MNTHIVYKTIPHIYINSVATSFLFGAGLMFITETQQYTHIPFLIAPAAYAGYHIFKNRGDIFYSFALLYLKR